MFKVCKWHRTFYPFTKRAWSILFRVSPISGEWRYFLIYTGPITHTHFVQTAEPSRVAVRQPSPQRTGLAVISKYNTDHSNPTTMQPVHGRFGCSFFSFPSFFFFFLQATGLKEKGCKEFVVSRWIHSQSAHCFSLSVPFQCLKMFAIYVINISSCVDISKVVSVALFLSYHQYRNRMRDRAVEMENFSCLSSFSSKRLFQVSS